MIVAAFCAISGFALGVMLMAILICGKHDEWED